MGWRARGHRPSAAFWFPRNAGVGLSVWVGSPSRHLFIPFSGRGFNPLIQLDFGPPQALYVPAESSWSTDHSRRTVYSLAQSGEWPALSIRYRRRSAIGVTIYVSVSAYRSMVYGCVPPAVLPCVPRRPVLDMRTFGNTRQAGRCLITSRVDPQPTIAHIEEGLTGRGWRDGCLRRRPPGSRPPATWIWRDSGWRRDTGRRRQEPQRDGRRLSRGSAVREQIPLQSAASSNDAYHLAGRSWSSVRGRHRST